MLGTLNDNNLYVTGREDAFHFKRWFGIGDQDVDLIPAGSFMIAGGIEFIGLGQDNTAFWMPQGRFFQESIISYWQKYNIFLNLSLFRKEKFW